jgi:hypothetical protein
VTRTNVARPQPTLLPGSRDRTAWALALARRYARIAAAAGPGDRILRRVQRPLEPAAALEARYFTYAPRLEWTVRLAPAIRLAAASAPRLELPLRPAAAPSAVQTARGPREAEMMAERLSGRTIRREPAPADASSASSSQAAARAGQPPPPTVPMVVHRGPPPAPARPGVPAAAVDAASDSPAPAWGNFGRLNTLAAPAIDMRRLADQVLDVIDRRTTAYRERMGEVD